MKRVRWSLRLAISILAAVTACAALVILVLYGMAAEYRHIESQTVKHVRFESDLLGNSITQFSREGGLDALRNAIASAATDEDVKMILVLDENGRVLASSRYELTGKALGETGVQADPSIIADARSSLAAFQSFSADRRELHSANYVVLGARPGELKPSRIGVLYEVHDLSGMKERAVREGMEMVFPIAIALAGIAAVFWLLFDRLISKRLSRLLAVSGEIAGGRYSSRVPPGWNDEIGRLGAAFNVMAENIGKNLDVIRRQGEQLDLSIRGSNLGVWDWRVGEDTVSHNAQWCRILGLDDSYLVHPMKDFTALLHDDERDAVMGRIQACLDGKGRYESEHRLRHADGHYLWVLDRGEVAERDAHGRPTRMAGSFADITERKKAEEALRESKARYRMLSEASFEGIVISVDGKVVDCNGAFARMFGYEPEELIGAVPRALTTPESQAVIMDHIRRNSEDAYEVQGIMKDGSQIIIEMRGRGILYRGQKARIAAVRDITAQVKAAEELRGSETRFRLLVESSPFCIHEIGPDGSFLSMNRAGLDMVGLKEERDVRGVSYLGLVREGDRGRVAGIMREAFGGEARTFEFDSAGDAPRRFKSCFVPIRGADGAVAKLMGVSEDITARMAADEALRESEGRYRTLAEASFEGIVIAVDGKIRDANSTFARIFGYTRDEIIGKSALDLSPRESHAIILDHISRGSEELYEAVGLKKDGTLFPIEMQGRAIIYMGVAARITALRDISERKKAEQAMRESEERLRMSFDNAISGMALVTLEGVVTQANRALCQIVGYRREELVGTPCRAIAYPDDRWFSENFLQRARRGETDRLDAEIRFVRKDGGVVWCSVVASVIKDAHGNPRHLFAHIIDITARKEAEEARRKSGQLLDAIVENIPNMIFLKRASDLCFERLNRAGEALLGLGRAELAGRGDYDFFPKEQADFFTGKDREALEKSGITDIPEEPIVTPRGTRILHTKKIALRDAYGRPEYLLGISEDITDRKAAEDALRNAKNEAEEATRLKDKFMSLVSHDLKTPLASMIGFLKLLRQMYGDRLDADANQILERAIESGQSMTRLIDDLLTISRFKTGKMKLNRQFFDAEYLGAMAAANYGHLAAQKGIEIENAIPAGYRIYGDKPLLAEAVQNLVGNAVKFCKGGDRITICAGTGDAPSIHVRDTGPGIDPHLLPDLFTFEKKTSTLGTAGETGTGFGLPLVKEIMRLHGGDLTLESGHGAGITFSLTLPYARPRILLVDDEAIFRTLQIERMRSLNADVIEAADGHEALDKLAASRFELVITDIQMPVMDGLELLKRIKGSAGMSEIPVIVMSGEFGMEVKDTIFRLGGSDFILKSAGREDLFPRVRRFIG